MLMSQAKIYWDLDNYAQVEKVSDNYEPLHACVGKLICHVHILRDIDNYAEVENMLLMNCNLLQLVRAVARRTTLAEALSMVKFSS